MPEDLLFSGDHPAATLNRLVTSGRARRLAPGIYTTDTASAPDRTVRRNWHRILGHLYPRGVVVADRSAASPAPVQSDGRLYVVTPGLRRPMPITLPGMTVLPRPGVGPIDGDAPMVEGRVWLASRARALVENQRPSRARTGPSRTLSNVEYEDWLDRIAQQAGATQLLALREEVETAAVALGMTEEGAAASHTLGVLLGTRESRLSSRSLRSRVAGRPYDARRVALFDVLASALGDRAPQPVLVHPNDQVRGRHTPFWEAYFSNYIEGTQFPVDEAERIIYEGFQPEGRPADAHDVLATYEIVSDPDRMHEVPESADHLIELLKSRHAHLMSARPDKHPGEFKTRQNQAGSTMFVAPDEVEETLREAWLRGAGLTDAFARAAFFGFVVAEVHPFDDGNGRMSRIMMNAELVSQDQCRVLIPNIYRNNYLSGLVALSGNSRATAYIDVIGFAQRFTSEIDFSDLDASERILRATNGLRDPRDADRYQLRLPSTLDINAVLLDDADGEDDDDTDEALSPGAQALANAIRAGVPGGAAAGRRSANRVWVPDYTKADGTHVRGYWRR